ncbi:phosphatidate cytidylyltransferase [Saccharicrinis fermentans]|uniref:Phosphatidate cytidylyltransferase n=1 Tax=Saccharicrinis fermentans DSM 9555 = JCM 21142 TaxID=869213 RepID=W7YA83_9BACT|nr:phosphatidate cytidylyltransferase [Saccharicrinis fermentans]GAF04473.1 phosphatidate cytidylyltransferase [Saccharicrinis fermentans DSM 9555 = JCM 21142]
MARKSYVKFASYFVIIHILFFSIVVNTLYFRYLSFVIVGVGFFELLYVFYVNQRKYILFYLFSCLIYCVLALGMFFFSVLSKEIILFAFLILSIFDSFSQITGQIWGKTKPFPAISPNKTVGGMVGGGVIAMGSSLLLNNLYSASFFQTILLAFGIVVFALVGDLAASFYKRKFHVKDYNHIIPGHGGFLDRFDSLIVGGAWVGFFFYVFSF